jgi:CheY-like chemotaxis protein
MSTNLETLRVLVADDYAESRHLYVHFLEASAIAVETADDGHTRHSKKCVAKNPMCWSWICACRSSTVGK